MPIVEWWDLWYRQIPGAAQEVDRMSLGVQRGLRELSNAGQDSLAPERQRSTPLESSPAVTTAPQPSPVGGSFEEFYKSVWDRPLGRASESSGKAPKLPHLPAPLPPEETSTPGSKVVPKSLFQSARKELLPRKGTTARTEAPPTKAQVSGNKKHASALELCTVEPVKCSSTARLNRLNHGLTILSFLQSLDQAQQRRLAVEDTRKQLRQLFGWAANTPIRWVIVDGPDWEPRLAVGTPEKAKKGTPRPKKGEELVFLPPQWEEEGDAAGTTWPVIAVKFSTRFSNPHAAEEALKGRRAQKQEAIDEDGKKTMKDSPSYSPLEEKEVTPAPEP